MSRRKEAVDTFFSTLFLFVPSQNFYFLMVILWVISVLVMNWLYLFNREEYHYDKDSKKKLSLLNN